jgi:hypothetical protein
MVSRSYFVPEMNFRVTMLGSQYTMQHIVIFPKFRGPLHDSERVLPISIKSWQSMPSSKNGVDYNIMFSVAQALTVIDSSHDIVLVDGVTREVQLIERLNRRSDSRVGNRCL